MKFAYSTNAFRKHSLPETIRHIAQLGFEGIEIAADIPHLYPPHYRDKAELAQLKSILKESGLAVSNLNTFTLLAVKDMHHPSWIEPEIYLREIRIQHTKDCLYLAKEIDCKNISIQPGGRLEHFNREQAEELFLAGLLEVIPLARKLGIRILIEPEPFLLLENSVQFENFIRQLSGHQDVVGLNCDIGHFYCANEDPVEVILRLHKFISHIHIEDIRNREHNHLICGEGEIDYRSVFNALRKIDYNGFISLELYPYQDQPVEAGRKSLEFLKSML